LDVQGDCDGVTVDESEAEAMTLPADQKALDDKLRDGCKRSLKFLCREVLGFKDWSKNPNLHDRIQRFMEKPTKFKLILIPRDHLKSTIITKGWSIQQMLRNPDVRILLANNTWDNARNFLQSIENYLTASVLPNLFGNFVSPRWNKDDCVIRQRRTISDAPTVATTGLEKEQTSQHYDIIIADDLVARENVKTKEQREKVKDYIASLYALLEPKGTMVVVGTRWSKDDAYEDLIEDGTWDKLVMDCYDGDPLKEKVLFPEKFTTDKLKDLRMKLRASLFSCWYENNPTAREASDFSEEWVRYYDPTTKNPMNLYLSVDPASSLGKDADFSAGTVSGKLPDGRIRVVDYFKRRLVPSELVDQIFETVRKWRALGHYVRVGVEAFTLKTLKTDIQNKQRAEKFYFQVDEIKKMRGPNGERSEVKLARIRGMQPLFEQGLIEIRSDMTDFVDELLTFPRGKHDDLIDSLSLAVDKLLPSSDITTIKEVQDGTMGALMKRIENRMCGTVYEEFMRDLNAVT
jgi:predicted phage terminase large subunit-like protein